MAREEAAGFEGLYQSEHNRLLRLARLLVGSDESAEDLVQDAFVRMYSVRVEPANPAAYLQTVLVNRCRDFLRRQAKGRRLLLPRAVEALPNDIDETWSAICRLPPRQREAVVLRYYLDLAEVDIARLLDCRPGTVKSTLSRALATLRKDLK